MTIKTGPSREYRRVRRLETGWRFHLGDLDDGADPELDDSGWEVVEVPHDWSIRGPFDSENPGGQQQGFAPGGVGWYRRELPADIDRDATIRFDGVYRNFDVYVDGEHVGHRPYGYSTVNDKLSEFGVDGGETLAVRVDNDEYPHSRWYTGSGIYRDVHLIETDSVAVAPFGTDIRTTAVNRHRAEVQMLTEVKNAESVELHQNDEPLGTQRADGFGPRPIEWYVPYEAGTLRAVAKEDGEVVAEHELETAGDPSRIELDADRETIIADGRDLAYVRATVTDDTGVRVPRADHEIRFDVSGAGEIAGVDNGNTDSNEPWVGDTRSAYRGTCITVVRADREGGTVEIEATADGLVGDGVTVTVEDAA
ncbi:sugar-binding domain-containing protein [Halopelagius fulvigenes]|uniref:Sugar-binding domain-containing protein n=2 Tax=Halopelagius fulvigenes TaxID=1198324 RepID=A0ABD5TWZ7_9EURY